MATLYGGGTVLLVAPARVDNILAAAAGNMTKMAPTCTQNKRHHILRYNILSLSQISFPCRRLCGSVPLLERTNKS